jgi:DICT domain-containing protein
MAALEHAHEQPMSAVELDAPLIRALQARARKERTTVDRLVRRLIAESLQELEDHEAVKAFRSRSGRTAPLAEVKTRLRVDRPARRRR